MAVFKNFKDDELIISCKCGCDEGIHFAIRDYKDRDYAFVTHTSSNYYREQCPFREKLKKIWAIIRNKDYYYSAWIRTILNSSKNGSTESRGNYYDKIRRI